MKRILLFLMTLLSVLLVVSLVFKTFFHLFDINIHSINAWLAFVAFVGVVGSFISLASSKWMAIRSTGAVVIENPSDSTERWLLDTVKQQARRARIAMPQVAVYDAVEVNALTTGMTKHKALLAVSRGLLQHLTPEEAEAVIAHEVSHIANGDMVTMALLQGVLNTYVLSVAYLINRLVNYVLPAKPPVEGDAAKNTIAFVLTVMLMGIFFGVLAYGLVMWFSRQREYRADAGAARLVSSKRMISALQRLRTNQDSQLPTAIMAFGFASKPAFSEFIQTHPPLEKRIMALQVKAAVLTMDTKRCC
jgi:heat shock protein HtpX